MVRKITNAILDESIGIALLFNGLNRKECLMPKLKYFLSIIVILSLILPAIAISQTTGKIDGFVKDKSTGDPLPGVNVMIKGTTVGAASGVDGYFYMINVPVGEYTVTASMMGYKTLSIQNVQVIVDQTTKINFNLEETVLDVGEEVVITAERPLIDPSVTSKISTMSFDEIKNMPAEDITRVLALQSNITVLTNTPYAKSGYNIRGIEDVRMRGGRNNELGLFIDGMKVGNPLFGGFGTRINNNAVNQMTVAAGGFSPEYGNALSGVINLSTREGGSRLSGQLEYGTSVPFGLKALASKRQEERNYQNVQFSLNGPVPFIRNLSFFFSADLSTEAGTLYEFDDFIWDDHRGDFPSSAELFQDFIEDGSMDLITRSQVESVLSPVEVGGKQRFINPLDTWKGWHGMGWDNDFDYLGKLTYRVNPMIKLSLSLAQSQSYSQINNFHAGYYYHLPGEWYNVDLNPVDTRENIDRLLVSESTGETYLLEAGNPFPDEFPGSGGAYQVWHRNGSGMAARNVQFRESNRQSLLWNHTLNPSTFYTVKIQRFFQSRRIRVVDDYTQKYDEIFGLKNLFSPDWDNIKEKEQYNHYNTYGVLDPWEGYFRMRYDNVYFSGDSSTTYDLRLDFTSQINRNHQLKFGAQYVHYDLFRHDDQGSSGPSDHPTIYHMTPNEGALYLMDKIEYGTIVLNIGARLDYSNAGGEMYKDPLDPIGEQDIETSEIEYNDFEESKKKFALSPRIGMAYPLTSKSVVHFNFGHFYQNPNYRDLYRATGDARELTLRSGQLMGNNSLEHEKSIQYEIGFQQQIGDIYGVNVTLWSKETTNQVGSVYVPAYSDPGGENPFGYYVFLNNNFGSARGVDITLQKRYRNYFSGTLNYTWSRARVLKQTSWDGYWDGESANTLPKRESIADWDQPHSIRVNINFSIPKDAGPTLLNTKVLSNFGVSLIYFGESGRVYTPYLGEAGFLEKENSARWPFFHQFDMRAYKNFEVFGLTYSVFAQVHNLFDRMNVIDGYTRTGSATDPGGAYPEYSATRMDGVSINNFGPRRSVTFGLRILW